METSARQNAATLFKLASSLEHAGKCGGSLLVPKGGTAMAHNENEVDLLPNRRKDNFFKKGELYSHMAWLQPRFNSLRTIRVS